MKKLSNLFLLTLSYLLLAGCLGGSGVDCELTVHSTGETIYCDSFFGEKAPVVYLLPTTNGEYTLAEFQPAVEFPNGLPLQQHVQIKLNGVDITDDFNDWGVSEFNVAKVTVPVDPINTPRIFAAVRDGRNSFQTTKPTKAVVYFNVDVPGAEVHITSVDDRSCGGVCMTNTNGVNVASRIYTPKRGNMIATGYIDGEEHSNVTRMCVNTYTINSLGVQSSLAGLDTGYSICDTVADGATTEGAYYLDFGNAGAWDFTFNVRDTGNNDTNYNENEVDVIEITVTDDTGTYATQWLRSNVPLWDSRLDNDGGFSISMDHIAMLSTGIGIVDLLHGEVISAPGNGADDITLADGFVITELYLGNDSIINLSIPDQNSSTTSRLRVDAQLEMRIRVDVPWWCLGGDMYTDTRNQFIPYSSNIDISINQGIDPYITRVNLVGQNIDISGIKGGGLCGAFADLFAGLINDIVAGVIQQVVGGIIANDVPTLRTKFGISVPGDNDYGPFYMPIQPEVTNFYGIPKGGTAGGTNNIKWGVMMGMHPRGSAPTSDPLSSRNVSLGVKWNGVPAPGSAALLANTATEEGTPALSTTLGVSITEDFINSLLLGLWESGMVYFEFQFDMPPELWASAYMYNTRFTMATRQPWEINLYPDGTPNGDAQLYFPDLVIELLTDSSLPIPLVDYNLATMIADVYFNININASPDGKALRLEVADNLQIDVKEVSSDWDNTSEAELIYILDQAFAQLGDGLAIDLPFPEILSSEVDIKAVNSDEFAIYVPIDVYNKDTYPKGPDGPLFAVSSVQSIGPGVSIPDGWRSLFNNVDDDNSLGMYPFHVYANRDYTRTCRSCGWCGCTFCGCSSWNPYYWTEGPFEWGFRTNLNGSYDFTGITLDRRNDCCDTRAEGYQQGLMVRAYNGGVFQGQWNAGKGGGTGVMTVDFGTTITADRFDVVVPVNSASDTYPNSRMWTGRADHVLNVTELDFIFAQ
jgi:hypothetical protein